MLNIACWDLYNFTILFEVTFHFSSLIWSLLFFVSCRFPSCTCLRTLADQSLYLFCFVHALSDLQPQHEQVYNLSCRVFIHWVSLLSLHSRNLFPKKSIDSCIYCQHMFFRNKGCIQIEVIINHYMFKVHILRYDSIDFNHALNQSTL